MSKTHHYKAKLIWIGAEQAPIEFSESYSREYLIEIDGKPSLRGAADPLFLGALTAHNPEDLLVASLSLSHMLCYLILAAHADLLVLGYEDSATGTMLFEGDKGRFTEVVLHPTVLVPEGSNLSLAKALHDRAHEQCFMASSVNFPVKHSAVVEEQVVELESV